MYFDDLQPCTYHNGPLDADAWAMPLRAVGWLEHPHPFTVGAAPDGLTARLKQLVAQSRNHFSQYVFRGVHNCSLCHAIGSGYGSVGWSQENLIVPGEGEIFAAPGGVVHYVEDHRYLPPPAFVAAVLACPDCGTPEYIEALQRANGGPIPMETSQDFADRIRSWRPRTP